MVTWEIVLTERVDVADAEEAAVGVEMESAIS